MMAEAATNQAQSSDTQHSPSSDESPDTYWRPFISEEDTAWLLAQLALPAPPTDTPEVKKTLSTPRLPSPDFGDVVLRASNETPERNAQITCSEATADTILHGDSTPPLHRPTGPTHNSGVRLVFNIASSLSGKILGLAKSATKQMTSRADESQVADAASFNLREDIPIFALDDERSRSPDGATTVTDRDSEPAEAQATPRVREQVAAIDRSVRLVADPMTTSLDFVSPLSCPSAHKTPKTRSTSPSQQGITDIVASALGKDYKSTIDSIHCTGNKFCVKCGILVTLVATTPTGNITNKTVTKCFEVPNSDGLFICIACAEVRNIANELTEQEDRDEVSPVMSLSEYLLVQYKNPCAAVLCPADLDQLIQGTILYLRDACNYRKAYAYSGALWANFLGGNALHGRFIKPSTCLVWPMLTNGGWNAVVRADGHWYIVICSERQDDQEEVVEAVQRYHVSLGASSFIYTSGFWQNNRTMVESSTNTLRAITEILHHVLFADPKSTMDCERFSAEHIAAFLTAPVEDKLAVLSAKLHWHNNIIRVKTKGEPRTSPPCLSSC